MPGPTGTIVDANSDPTSVDSWALVDSTNTVVNIAVGDFTWASGVTNDYTYIVDITVGAQSCQIGYIYDSTDDTFSPPPNPYIGILEADLATTMGVLSDCLYDATQMSPDDLTTAYNNFISNNSGSFTPNELAVMTALYAYLAEGG